MANTEKTPFRTVNVAELIMLGYALEGAMRKADVDPRKVWLDHTAYQQEAYHDNAGIAVLAETEELAQRAADFVVKWLEKRGHGTLETSCYGKHQVCPWFRTSSYRRGGSAPGAMIVLTNTHYIGD